jgi:hypothetical protein
LSPDRSKHSFLQSLEPWEAALFHTIELRYSPHEIVRYLAEETFLGVSDGAEKYKCAAFGWMTSRSNGHRLVRCTGPVYGADPSSFRAEGYGFLSMLRFLLRLAEYCDTPQLYECTLASDNLDLITRIKESGSTVLHPALSLSLAPDWDIVNEIEIACEQLQIQHPPTIQLVKGHQDREKDY